MDWKRAFTVPKRALTLLMMLAVVTAAFAAGDSICIGKRPDGSEVMAEKHFFGKRIERFESVPGKNQLCISFIEKTGTLSQELALYDVMRHRLLWVSEMDFSQDCYVPSSQGILVYFDNKTHLLNDAGDVLWESKFYPVYVDEEHGMVLGYKNATSKDLVGVGLKDGEVKWQGVLKHKLGWNEIMEANDGRLVICAEDLCVLNPENGQMKTQKIFNMFERKNTDLDKDARLKVFLSAYLFGLIGGGLAAGIIAQKNGANFWTGKGALPNMVGHLNSNICAEGDRLYFADRRYLRCLDYDLNVIWETMLPSGASRSLLEISGDTLFYKNSGLGMDYEDNEIEDTKPYSLWVMKDSGTKIDYGKEDAEPKSLFFLKEEGVNQFKPLWLTLDAKESTAFFCIDKQLTSSLFSIHKGNDYWIVNKSGDVRLHLNDAILQTALFGHCFVGLTLDNVLFQFNIYDL